jgi:homoserine kinase
MRTEIRAFAPASIGNVGVGFDTLGMAIAAPGDEVVARLSTQSGVRIALQTGDNGRLPLETEKNTAGVAVQHLLAHIGRMDIGIELDVHKKLPLGSGMGSSAASAVAAVVAVNELLSTGLTKRDLLPFACAGEQVASGGFHADNVAPSLLGGIVLIRDNATLDVHQLPVPEGLFVVVVHPNVQVLTKEARAILKPDVPLKTHVLQSAHLAAFVTGLFTHDLALVGRSLRDYVIEPQRAQLIPAFYDAQKAAMDAGALGCSISGAGPSMFALCEGEEVAGRVGVSMQRAFDHIIIKSSIYTSEVNQTGAYLM